MMSSDRPIVILACRVFQHWLEELLPEHWNAQVSFFDYGLHAVPKNLRQTLQQAIDSIEQPSLIVLGYGLCGKGLDQLEAGKHFLLIPRTDDCIAILLGSYQAYRREMEREPGTYYLSKGWLEAGTNPLAESQKYEKKYDAETAAYLMDTQYRHYRRLALVARDERNWRHTARRPRLWLPTVPAGACAMKNCLALMVICGGCWRLPPFLSRWETIFCWSRLEAS